jgi:serine/threonine protein kinase
VVLNGLPNVLAMSYADYDQFPDMLDFLAKLLQSDPVNRLTAREALEHPWLGAKPYQESITRQLKNIETKMLNVNLSRVQEGGSFSCAAT